MWRVMCWWNSLRKSAERGQCCSQRPRSFWSAALPNSSASLKVPMGTDSWDEVGMSIKLLTYAHAGAHGLRCLQQWRRFLLTSFRQRKIHWKMCKDIYMAFLCQDTSQPQLDKVFWLYFARRRRGEASCLLQCKQTRWSETAGEIKASSSTL